MSISDFALMENVDVSFDSGFVAVTGASGSGKSVLLRALTLVLGGQLSSGEPVIRPPATRATLSATFAVGEEEQSAIREVLGSAAADDLEGTVVLRRAISYRAPGGSGVSSRCSVNGVNVPLKSLAHVGRLLCDVNGQASSLLLIRDDTRRRDRELLDEVAGTVDARRRLRADFERYKAMKRKLRSLPRELDADEVRDLEAMISDVHEVAPLPEEDVMLKREIRVLETNGASLASLQRIAHTLNGDGGGEALAVSSVINSLTADVSAICRQLQRAGGGGGGDGGDGDGLTELGDALADLEACSEALEGASRSIDAWIAQQAFDGHRKQEMEERLRQIESLARRYGAAGASELSARVSAAEELLLDLDSLADRRAELCAALSRRREALVQSAVGLSAARRAAVDHTVRSVEENMRAMGLEDSVFRVVVDWVQEAQGCAHGGGEDEVDFEDEDDGTLTITASDVQRLGDAELVPAPGVYRLDDGGGLDAVAFMLSASKGEPLRNLNCIASGGEAARTLLALKAIPLPPRTDRAAGARSPRVLVFDEIDSSIGARNGRAVGLMLKRMTEGASAAGTQVITVTHLPQVAAAARQHLQVAKSVEDGVEEGRAISVVSELAEHDRVREIASMLGCMGLEEARQLMREGSG